MFCPQCGKELTDGSAYCTGCGAPTSNKTTPNQGNLTRVESGGTGKSKKPRFTVIVAVAVIMIAVIAGAAIAIIFFGPISENDNMTSASTASASPSAVSATASDNSSAEQSSDAELAASEVTSSLPSSLPKEDVTIVGETIDPTNKNGYKINGTITNNRLHDIDDVTFRYRYSYIAEDGYGDDAEFFHEIDQHVYDLHAGESRNYEFLITDPGTAGYIENVELKHVSVGNNADITSERTLSPEEYSIDNLEWNGSTITGTITNKSGYKWERVKVSVLRAYDADDNVLWAYPGKYDPERPSSDRLTLGKPVCDDLNGVFANFSADYVKDGETSKFNSQYQYSMPEGALDHYDVRVVVEPGQ